MAVATEAPPSRTAPLSEHRRHAGDEPLNAILVAAQQLANMNPSPSPTATNHTTRQQDPYILSRSPSHPSQTSTELRKPCYKTTLVRVTPSDLTAVRLPQYYPRDTNRRHVEQLKMSLLHDGIDDESGFIAFCGQPPNRNVVRGAQLLQAFCELYINGRVCYVEHDDSISVQEYQRKLGYCNGVLSTGKINCAFVERIDETGGDAVVHTPFSATETLLLAAHYNSKNGHIRPMTMLDNITLAQRFIQCRLRDLHLSDHLYSSRRRSAPPNVVWSKLPQFVAEATACNLIPYSTTPSAPPNLDIPSDVNGNDPALWRQHIRTIRQRQAEYIRLALSLLWSPHTQNLIMNRCTFESNTLSCSLWSLRTFRLRPFTSADDSVQFVMLLALYRCQQERRSLRLRPFDRDKTKRFLELIASCVQKLLSCAMNRTKPPFPTKWDIFNAITTITTGPPTIQPSPQGQQDQQQVSIADILMSLLTRWDHAAATTNAPTQSAAGDNSCTGQNIIFSLQCFMQRWPFNRKWRFLSPSLPCFQPDLFLQPLLPLESIRFWPVHAPSSTDMASVRPPAILSAAQQAVHPTGPPHQQLQSLVKTLQQRHATHSAAIAPQPPVRLAKLLPAVDDRAAPLGREFQATPQGQTSSWLFKNISPLHNSTPVVQKALAVVSAAAVTDALPPNPSSIELQTPRTNISLGRVMENNRIVPSETDNVDEEMIDGGEGRRFVDDSNEDDECTDTYATGRNTDDINYTDTDPIVQSRARSRDVTVEGERSKRVRHDRSNAVPTLECSAPVSALISSSTVQYRRSKKQKTKRTSAAIRDSLRAGAPTDCDTADDEDDEEQLEPLYDKISAKLPPPTGVYNLPSTCHVGGAWDRYLTNEDVTDLASLIRSRCAALYYSEEHKEEGDAVRDWPCLVGRRAYCNSRRTELHNDGYTILRNVLADSVLAADADSVINHFAKFWKGERRYTQIQQQKSVWKHIFNRGGQHDPENANNGIGRYTVGVEDLVDRLIRHNPELFTKRLRVETALGVLIQDVIQDNNQQHPLRFPVTGSRLLFQTRHTPPQLAHYDFGNIKYNPEKTPWNPGSDDISYFAMMAGAEGFHLRIWTDGHRMMYGPFELVRKIAKTLQSQVIFIPPYSALIVRGDLPHAGVGGEEADGPESPTSPNQLMHIRFHMYVSRHFDRLKDGVYVARHKLLINDRANN